MFYKHLLLIYLFTYLFIYFFIYIVLFSCLYYGTELMYKRRHFTQKIVICLKHCTCWAIMQVKVDSTITRKVIECS